MPEYLPHPPAMMKHVQLARERGREAGLIVATIPFSVTKHGRINGQHDRFTSSCGGLLQQSFPNRILRIKVELKPVSQPWGNSHIGDRGIGDRALGKCNALDGRSPCQRQVAPVPQKAIKSGGRDREGQRAGRSEDGPLQIDMRNVPQHTGLKFDFVEGLSIGH